MTALAGVFRLDGQRVDEATLRRMVQPVMHRGTGNPDIAVSGPAGLAQVGMPATSPAGSPAKIGTLGRTSGVFDGRLDDVDALGGRLGLSSDLVLDDVDLLLRAYEKWGRATASHLRGDFAFAIFDASSGSLYCGRDPIGTRMFHYYRNDKAIYFATEIKQILTAPGVPASAAEIDPDMLSLYLCGAAQYGDLTFYRGIRRLQGGFTLSTAAGSVNTSSFWDMRDQEPIRHRDPAEYASHFKDLLFTAVNDRLRGEGPVSIELSGGLDSGSVACIAGATASRHGRPLNAVYFRQSQPDFDELPFVEEICATYGIGLETVDADDCWAMKPDLLADTRDEPFIVPFELLNQKALQAAAATGARTVLTGEGGDEAFAPGYMLYLRDWLMSGRIIPLIRDLKSGSPQYRKNGIKQLRQHIMPGFVRRMLGRYRATVPPWITNEFKNRTDLQRRMEASLGSSYMDRNYFSGRGSHPFHVLWDHRAASFGMEPSHPLWDLRVVEFLSLIPPSVRLQGGNGKQLLKKSLQDVLTPGLMQRQPYAAMTRLFARGWHEERDRFEEVCERSELARREVIDSGEVFDRYEAYLGGDQAKVARLFWTLIADDWLMDRYPEVITAAKGGHDS